MIKNHSFIKSIDDIEIDEWEKFVLKHPQGCIFQSSHFYEIIKKTKNWNPYSYFILVKGQIVASLLVVLQKEYKGVIGYLTSRAIIWGGPLVKDNDLNLFDLLMDFFVNDIKKKSIYIQFRNLSNIKFYQSSFNKNKFYYEKHLNILIKLTSPFELIFDSFHKSKRRNFTKSTNKGVIFKEIYDKDAVYDAYNLVLKTYSRIELPVPDISHFIALSELINKQMCKFFAVYFENIMIGVRVELLYNGIIYDYYAGADNSHSNKFPNDYLITNILKWGSDNNWIIFDFGGAGKPNKPYSVRDYKLKFSNNLVQFGRYTKINNKVLYALAVFGFYIWKISKKYIHIKG